MIRSDKIFSLQRFSKLRAITTNDFHTPHKDPTLLSVPKRQMHYLWFKIYTASFWLFCLSLTMLFKIMQNHYKQFPCATQGPCTTQCPKEAYTLFGFVRICDLKFIALLALAFEPCKHVRRQQHHTWMLGQSVGWLSIRAGPTAFTSLQFSQKVAIGNGDKPPSSLDEKPAPFLDLR
jgi:hypothetical protein